MQKEVGDRYRTRHGFHPPRMELDGPGIALADPIRVHTIFVL